jgi:hypothetical protein
LTDFLQHRQSRPLATRTAAGSTTKKCDEFPSPHDIAHAEDYIGHEENITFLDREYRSALPKQAGAMSALGH